MSSLASYPYWQAGKAYTENDIVTWRGGLKQARINHTAGTDFVTDERAGKWLDFDASPAYVGEGAGGAAADSITVKSITDTSYTLLADDKGLELMLSNAAAITLTIPADVFAEGDIVYGRQTGAGQVTLTAGGGATINQTGKKTLRQHAAFMITARAANVFDVDGELTA
jgi:hypothetical protein